MSVLQRRVKGVLYRVGDSFQLSGTARYGVFAPLGQADSDSALSKPSWLAYVPHDVSVSANEPVVWNGQNLTVKKVVDARFRSETVAKMLVVA